MQAVIFDVDGTLWDSTEKVAISWRETCRRRGVDGRHITKERLMGEFGKLLDDIGISLFPDLPKEEAIALTAIACDEELDYLHIDPPKLYDGIPELFIALREMGLKTCIVSNAQKGYVETLLDVTCLSPYVDSYLQAGDTGTDKAGTIRILMERESIESAVYVGDTYGDFTATKAAGLPFVHAAYGFGEVPEPDARIFHPLELPDVIRKLASK